MSEEERGEREERYWEGALWCTHASRDSGQSVRHGEVRTYGEAGRESSSTKLTPVL